MKDKKIGDTESKSLVVGGGGKEMRGKIRIRNTSDGERKREVWGISH